MTTLSVSEKRLAAAIEPWFGEDAGTVAILLAVLNAEGRAHFAAGLTERIDDPTALLAAINDAQASDSPEKP